MKISFKNCFANSKGMTLLEVMISMIILAIGVLGLAPMMVISIFGNSFSNQVTMADAIALDRLEEIRNWSYVSPVPYSQTVNNVDRIFTRETIINDNASDGTVPVGVYKIRVTTTWTDHKEVNRSVSYYTYKAKNW
ncbi:MAG: prepilin-type N-terminal cleavage/methylation domain-containing protein [Candidatus Zixiibacteriota bacterium]